MIQEKIIDDSDTSVSSDVIELLVGAETEANTEPEEFNRLGEFYANVFGRTH